MSDTLQLAVSWAALRRKKPRAFSDFTPVGVWHSYRSEPNYGSRQGWSLSDIWLTHFFELE
jgi:hypothetical protein